MSTNPYLVLGLREDATGDQIKRAYRSLVFLCHPDRNPNDLTAANARMVALTQAYKRLETPEARAKVDAELWAARVSGRSPVNPPPPRTETPRTDTTTPPNVGQQVAGAAWRARVEALRKRYPTFDDELLWSLFVYESVTGAPSSTLAATTVGVSFVMMKTVWSMFMNSSSRVAESTSHKTTGAQPRDAQGRFVSKKRKRAA